jgi:hypothetical protein
MSDDDALRGVWRRLYLAVIISVSIDDSKAFRGWIWLYEHIEWLAGMKSARHASSRLVDLNKALLLSPTVGMSCCLPSCQLSCAKPRPSYSSAIFTLHLGNRIAHDTRAETYHHGRHVGLVLQEKSQVFDQEVPNANCPSLWLMSLHNFPFRDLQYCSREEQLTKPCAFP